jgi:uncharacterized Zn finger protein (UPF0148 family)
MVALFRPSTDEAELVRTTVESLGATSVPGLAAALSWRQRKVEKVLAEELIRPGTPLAYDPATRLVRWAVEPALEPSTAGPTPSTSGGASRLPPGPAPVRVGTGFKLLCPSCRVGLVPASSGTLSVCPQCGRLSSSRVAVSEESAARPAPSGTGTPGLADRKTQEMLAAYVTAKPIPCPRCRTPLRHRGLSQYSCPNCGESVRFSHSGAYGPPASPADPAAPASRPSETSASPAPNPGATRDPGTARPAPESHSSAVLRGFLAAAYSQSPPAVEATSSAPLAGPPLGDSSGAAAPGVPGTSDHLSGPVSPILRGFLSAAYAQSFEWTPPEESLPAPDPIPGAPALPLALETVALPAVPGEPLAPELPSEISRRRKARRKAAPDRPARSPGAPEWRNSPSSPTPTGARPRANCRTPARHGN